MLYLDFKDPKKILWNVKGRYEIFYESSWFDDPVVVRIAEQVDQVKHLYGDRFRSDYSGDFSGLTLSGGAQILILCYLNLFEDYCLPLSWVADNCLEVLGSLPISHPVHFFANTVPLLDDYKCQFISSETGKLITGHDEYIPEYYEYARTKNVSSS